MFENPAYIVLDIPAPVADEVQRLRDRFDAVVANLPVEITVIGSSGIGTIARDQDGAQVFGILDELAKDLSPIVTSFAGIGRFPNTAIFYLAPRHPEKFAAMQEAIARTRIAFDSSPFPYTPHCTIRSVGEVAAEDEKALLSLKVPEQEFLLDTLSVYELVNNRQCNLLHRTRLAGKERG